MAAFMAVLRFEQEMHVVRRGELGSWFGLLLTGALRVEVRAQPRHSFVNGSSVQVPVQGLGGWSISVFPQPAGSSAARRAWLAG